MLDLTKISNFEKRAQIIADSIASIENFPKEGILFRDITTLLENPSAFKDTNDLLFDIYKDEKIDCVVAADARGFIFGSVLAYKLGCKLVLVRKKGKLPRETYNVDYDLEYGSNTLEICKESLSKGERVLLIDDLLATGGTAGAMIELVRKAGADVASFAFIFELFDLEGAKKIKDKYNVDVLSLVKFPGH